MAKLFLKRFSILWLLFCKIPLDALASVQLNRLQEAHLEQQKLLDRTIFQTFFDENYWYLCAVMIAVSGFGYLMGNRPLILVGLGIMLVPFLTTYLSALTIVACALMLAIVVLNLLGIRL